MCKACSPINVRLLKTYFSVWVFCNNFDHCLFGNSTGTSHDSSHELQVHINVFHYALWVCWMNKTIWQPAYHTKCRRTDSVKYGTCTWLYTVSVFTRLSGRITFLQVKNVLTDTFMVTDIHTSQSGCVLWHKINY